MIYFYLVTNIICYRFLIYDSATLHPGHPDRVLIFASERVRTLLLIARIPRINKLPDLRRWNF
jgi:hypothetical protein